MVSNSLSRMKDLSIGFTPIFILLITTCYLCFNVESAFSSTRYFFGFSVLTVGLFQFSSFFSEKIEAVITINEFALFSVLLIWQNSMLAGLLFSTYYIVVFKNNISIIFSGSMLVIGFLALLGHIEINFAAYLLAVCTLFLFLFELYSRDNGKSLNLMAISLLCYGFILNKILTIDLGYAFLFLSLIRFFTSRKMFLLRLNSLGYVCLALFWCFEFNSVEHIFVFCFLINVISTAGTKVLELNKNIGNIQMAFYSIFVVILIYSMKVNQNMFNLLLLPLIMYLLIESLRRLRRSSIGLNEVLSVITAIIYGITRINI